MDPIPSRPERRADESSVVPPGRARAFGLLSERFAASAAGRAGVVLAHGEPGIGKSHLLTALAARAASAGATVLRGGASEAEGMPPYLPFLEALGEQIAASSAEELRAQLGVNAAILVGILPELATRIDVDASDYPLPPEQARLRLYEAVGAWLAAIAERAPVLLLLDDLQWADAATLDLLCHVARHRADARLLIVGAYRDGEGEQNPALVRAIAELNRHRLLTTLALEPLTLEALAELAATFLGGLLWSDLARFLFTQSEGNPFFAEELLRGWWESGALVQTAEGWRLERPAEVELPASLSVAIAQRLARLPDPVNECLRSAAIVGRTFEVSFLADVTGQDPEQVEQQLAIAARARVIQAVPGSEGSYRFIHDKLRECLYREVTHVRRRRLHGFIGHALETSVLAGQPSARHLADLAFHFSRSGDRERGSRYAEQAARQALESYAAEEAIGLFRAALELADPGDQRRGALLFGLGEAAVLAGAEGDALESFAAARDAFQRAGEPVAAARAAHGLGTALARLERTDEARAALESALRLLDDRPVPETARILADLGTLLAVSLGQLDAGIELARRAVRLAEQLDDRGLEALTKRTLGNLLVRATQFEPGVALLNRALALATALDDPSEAAECCACLSIAYCWQGDVRGGRDASERQRAFAERSRDIYQLRHVHTWLYTLDAMTGNWVVADAHRDQAWAVVERLGSPEPLAFLQQTFGVVAYARGEYAQAAEWFDRAMPIFRAMGQSGLVWYLGPYALALLMAGRRTEALERAVELDRILDHQPSGSMMVAEAASCLGLLAVELVDGERAAHHAAQLDAFRGCHTNFPIDYVLGRIALLQRDWRAASAYLAAAETTARRYQLALDLGLILVALADLELGQGRAGDRERARQHLEEAHTLYQQLELPALAGDVERRLSRLGRRGPADSRAIPAGLSRREVEVLGLVSAGLSNRAIAEALSISEKTVANHLTSIFNKIAVDNRVAAAAFAIRHGLA